MRDRLEVVPGAGTVLHYGRIVVWAGTSASPALVEFLTSSARNLASSPAGGRQLADHIAGVLSSRDPEPAAPFVTVGPDGPRWSVLMHGPVQLWDGTQWLAPSPSPGWLSSQLDPRPWALVGPAGTSMAQPRPDSSLDMESGSVTGGGFVFWPGDEPPGEATGLQSGTAESTLGAPPATFEEADEAFGQAPDPEAGPFGSVQSSPPPAVPGTFASEPPPAGPAPAGPAPAPADLPGPAPSPAGPVMPSGLPPAGIPAGERRAPAGAIDLRQPAGLAPYPPLPAVGSPEEPTDPGAPFVSGARCPNRHLNPPASATCARCGATITGGGDVQSARRPSLGVLVCDDGSVYRLDSGYVAGRRPEIDPEVVRGSSRPLPLAGGGPELSDAHAAIRLGDWTVELVDRGSGAATFVLPPGQTAWNRLASGQARVLDHGTHIAVGQRVITFLSRF